MRALFSRISSLLAKEPPKSAGVPPAKAFPSATTDAGIQWTLTEEQVRDSLDWWAGAITAEEITAWQRYHAASESRRAPRRFRVAARCARRVALIVRRFRWPLKAGS